MRPITLGLLMLVLLGCGSARSALDPLERYQRLSGAFRHLSLLDSAVSMDGRRLERSLRLMRPRAIIAAARAARRDARDASSLAGWMFATITSISRLERRRVVRAYFSLARASVQEQGRESDHVEQAMVLIETDPFLLGSRHERRFETEFDKAVKDASRAVSLARRAAMREREIRRHLRFTPVAALAG